MAKVKLTNMSNVMYTADERFDNEQSKVETHILNRKNRWFKGIEERDG